VHYPRWVSMRPRKGKWFLYIADRFPTISPVAWLTIERVTQQALWLVLFAILAPILGPGPYGLFAIVMVFVGFCELVLLEGTVEALVTVGELENDHMNTANLINVVISIAFGLLMSVSAPWLGDIFHDDQMRLVIWILAPMPLLSVLSAPPIAVLRHSLQYKRLAIRSILGLTLGGIFGIIVGIMGGGVLALVAQVMAQRLAELTIGWVSVPIRFGCKWSARHFDELRPVALNVLTARMASLLTGQFPRVVLGYVLGPTEVAFFSLANRFVDIIINSSVVPLTQVARIELRTIQSGTPEFGRQIAKVVQRASMLSFPCFLGMAALVPELFRLGLDHRWEASIIPIQLMLLSGPPLTVFYCIDAALLATNLSSVFRKIAHWQGLTLVATVLCAVPFGLNIICLALAIRAWIALPVFSIAFSQSCHISVSRLLLPSLPSLIGALCMAAFVSLPPLHPVWLRHGTDVILLVAVGIIFYMVFLYFFARDQLMELLGDILSYKTSRSVVSCGDKPIVTGHHLSKPAQAVGKV
jgi:O-antigen/teichoic acid export membrane protein